MKKESEIPHLAYRDALWRALPRLLAGFERDTTSSVFGCGDRLYWAWKLIDFPNATFQGAAGGLARLVRSRALPDWLPRSAALARIDAAFEGTRAVMARDGGLGEAFPNEGSFCVTGMVAGDLAQAIEDVKEEISTSDYARYIDIIRPMIGFLHRRDESHAVISNHLATVALALYKWTDISGESADARAGELIDRILHHQSEEGWYLEYEGADPGYQTWCTSSLARIHSCRPHLGLYASLERSLKFLWHFAHPDGSFGGIYGSRMARFMFPSGFEKLACDIPEAASLAAFARGSIARSDCVTLDSMDPPNLVPLFNDYAFAQDMASPLPEAPPLPADGETKHRYFEHAGILIDRGERHYSIIATHKGGAFQHFTGRTLVRKDAGFVGRTSSGQLVATQLIDRDTSVELISGEVAILAPLRRIVRPLPDAKRFVLLRIMCVTIFRWSVTSEIMKKWMARYLVTRKPRICGHVRRRLVLGEGMSVVDEVIDGDVQSIVDAPHFSAIHMASQGYWQRSDDQL